MSTLSKSKERKRPLGVFDSGVGGLTVVKEIFRQLPGENIVYFGDTARVPYGNKSRETVTRYASEISEYLIKKHKVKALIVACNTASALALGHLKKKFSHIPIFGVIQPASLKALNISLRKKIAVIGTEATISSGAYPQAILKKEPAARVYQTPCPLLVPIVEEGRLKSEITEMIIRDYLKKIPMDKIDALILGCTHYPLIAGLIGKVAGKKVAIVDSASAVVEAVKKELYRRDLIRQHEGKTEISKSCALYCVSDSPQNFARTATRFLKGKFNGNVIKVDMAQIQFHKT